MTHRAPSTMSHRAPSAMSHRAPGTGHVQETGAVAGYRPERTLRLWVELRRQFKRRRTIGVFLLMVALPLILIAALQLGASDNAQQNSRINLVDVANRGGVRLGARADYPAQDLQRLQC